MTAPIYTKTSASEISEVIQFSTRIHRAQAAILQDPHRFVTAISGRRFGKSSLQLVRLLEKTVEPWSGVGIRPSVLGVAPTHPQCRSVLFQPFLDFCYGIFGDGFEKMAKVNDTRMTVDFGKRYPLLRFSGAHGHAAERLRGLKLTHCSVDEAKDVSWAFLNKVVFPALADLRGTGLFTGTPAGRSNTLYKLYAKTGGEFSSHNYSSYANTLIPGFKESLDELRLLLPPEDFATEILGRFTDTAGNYYTSFRPARHIAANVSGLPQVLSWFVGFDPGARNRGWVIVAQLAEGGGKNFQVVHAVSQSEAGLDTAELDAVKAALFGLQSKHGGKLLFVAIDPSRPDLIVTMRRQRTNSLKAVNSFESGIGVVNTLFHQNRLTISSHSWVSGDSLAWFTEQVQDYHRKANSLGEILDTEASDIPTHTLDGLRYAFSTLDKLTPDLLGISSLLPSASPKGKSSVLA